RRAGGRREAAHTVPEQDGDRGAGVVAHGEVVVAVAVEVAGGDRERRRDGGERRAGGEAAAAVAEEDPHVAEVAPADREVDVAIAVERSEREGRRGPADGDGRPCGR